jgi:hypothetical protein
MDSQVTDEIIFPGLLMLKKSPQESATEYRATLPFGGFLLLFFGCTDKIYFLQIVKPLNKSIMGLIMISTVPVLKYTGIKGSGPVLEAGKQTVTVAAVMLTNDSVTNPWGDLSDQPVKETAYDDCRLVIATKVSNQSGGLTERFHFDGFRKWIDLSETEKASGKFTHDLASGYALEPMIDPATGKKIPIDTGEVKDGKPVRRAAMTRIVDAKKSEQAQRILSDFLVACRVPANDNMTPEAIVEAIGKCTDKFQITVIHDTYEGKTRARMQSPVAIGTAVPASVDAEESLKDDDEF